MTDDFKDQVQKVVQSNKIVLFIKGTKETPMCGFSAAVVGIFKQLGEPFETVDILANPEIRMRLEEFSKWPTFPQVFINGKLVGGCDIMHELRDSGDLAKLLDQAFKN